MSKIIFAFALLAIIGAVISTTCKDGSTCPGTTTCCLSPQGTVGCCPYENASCCSDGLHCCPNGYTCDLAKGQCVQGSNSFLAFVSLSESAPAKTTPSLGRFPDIEHITDCLKDGYDITDDIMRAFGEFKKMTKEGRQNAKFILIETLKKTPNMALDCVKIIEDLLK